MNSDSARNDDGSRNCNKLKAFSESVGSTLAYCRAKIFILFNIYFSM